VHMVLQGENGSVTVLLMPGEQIDTRNPVDNGRFSGVIAPTRYCSMAIVGEDGEDLRGGD